MKEFSGIPPSAEFFSYAKFGDHATSLPSNVRFATNGVFNKSIQYKYDSMGNIIEIFENGRSACRYEYDALGRLTREDNVAFGKTTTWSYDNNGNIIARYEYAITAKPTSELHLLDCVTKLYAYQDNSDQLMSYDGTAFVYDTIGNPTTYRGKTATWAYGRQLMSFDGNTFEYDARGRRTAKNGITFTYDSNGNLIKQSNGLEFLYDHSGVFALKYNGSTYFYRKDAQANIVALLDSNGSVVVKYGYDAWGNCKVLNANGVEITDNTHIGILNPFRYRSYYYDHGIGLYFLKTRYYDPQIGRFMTIDDISYLDPESINGLNLYAYCGDNPVNRYDFTGCDWKSFWNSTWGKIIGTTLVVVAVIVLSIATAGVGTAVAGALGGGFWAAIAGGAVGGAISGAIFGAGISIVSQGVTNGYSNIDYGKVAIDGLIGMASGAVSGAVFAGIGRGLGLLGKTKWAQRTLSNFDDVSKNYMFGSKSGNFTFLRNGKAFRLEASLQHGLHYHSLAAGTTAPQWELIFKISNLIAGALGGSIGNVLY